MSAPGELAEVTAVTYVGEPATSGFVGRFGLDPWLLFAQIVNFLVVVLVLQYVVFRPLFRMVRERTAAVRKGLDDAQDAAALRASAMSEKERVIRDAAEKAARSLRAGEEEANRLRESVLRTAEDEAAAMHDRAGVDAARLKQDALRAAAADAGDLVVDAMEQVLTKTLTSGEREAYRDAALRTLRTRTP